MADCQTVSCCVRMLCNLIEDIFYKLYIYVYLYVHKKNLKNAGAPRVFIESVSKTRSTVIMQSNSFFLLCSACFLAMPIGQAYDFENHTTICTCSCQKKLGRKSSFCSQFCVLLFPDKRISVDTNILQVQHTHSNYIINNLRRNTYVVDFDHLFTRKRGVGYY